MLKFFFASEHVPLSFAISSQELAHRHVHPGLVIVTTQDPKELRGDQSRDPSTAFAFIPSPFPIPKANTNNKTSATEDIQP